MRTYRLVNTTIALLLTLLLAACDRDDGGTDPAPGDADASADVDATGATDGPDGSGEGTDAAAAPDATETTGDGADTTDVDSGPSDDATDTSGDPCAGVDCDDGLDCTIDTCAEGVCVHTPDEGHCAIGDACYAAGDVSPDDGCERCQPDEDAETWSAADGLACDDGIACTVDDACVAGTCKGTETPACEPGCGNGVVEPPEVCDDGDKVAVDLCSAECEPGQVVLFEGSADTAPSVAQGDDGTLYAAVTLEGTVSLRRFSAAGAPIDEVPLAVSTTDEAGFGGARAVVAGGHVAVIWYAGGGLLARRIATGDSLSFPEPSDQIIVDEPPGSYPSVITSGPDELVVAWAGTDTDGGGARFRRFSSDLAPLAESVVANSDPTGDQGQPAIAALGGGGFVVAWRGPTGPSGWGQSVHVRRFDADGSPTDPTDLKANTEDGQLLSPTVATLGDGFIVAWQRKAEEIDVHFRIFGSDGKPLGAVTTGNTSTAGHQGSVRVTPGASGFLLTFTDTAGCLGGCSGEDVRGRRFGPDGSPVDAEDFLLPEDSEGTQGDPGSFLLPDGDYAALFRSGSTLFMRRFSAAP